MRVASDLIFSHVITFLNDKNDRHLRGSFFDCLAGVASYIGWSCAPICQPLLQQGLSDAEEFVAVKAVESMIGLTQLGLLPKPTLLGLLHDTASFLIHPNRWIRHVTEIANIPYLKANEIFMFSSLGCCRIRLLCRASFECSRRSVSSGCHSRPLFTLSCRSDGPRISPTRGSSTTNLTRNLG